MKRRVRERLRAAPRTLGQKAEAPLSDLIEGEDYARECLELSAKILLAAGHPKERLVRILQGVAAELRTPTRPAGRRGPRFVADLPHILAHWHADPRYFSSGRAQPLPFGGIGPSLTEIIQKVFPQEAPTSVLRALLSSGAIRRQGKRYMPTSRAVLFAGDRASGRTHALIAWRGFLQTVDQNLSGNRQFLQRTALNSRYPVAAVPAFGKRLDEVATKVLYPFDDFMLRQEQTRSGRRALMGFGMFGFRLPTPTEAARPRKSQDARPRRKGMA